MQRNLFGDHLWCLVLEQIHARIVVHVDSIGQVRIWQEKSLGQVKSSRYTRQRAMALSALCATVRRCTSPHALCLIFTEAATVLEVCKHVESRVYLSRFVHVRERGRLRLIKRAKPSHELLIMLLLGEARCEA
jgi:hypothetical protein